MIYSTKRKQQIKSRRIYMFWKKKKEEKKQIKNDKGLKVEKAETQTSLKAKKSSEIVKNKQKETKKNSSSTKPAKKEPEKKLATKKPKAKVAEKKAENAGIYRVVYDKTDRLWKIKKDGAKRVIATMPTKEEALSRVKELSEIKDVGFVVHKKDGKFQKK